MSTSQKIVEDMLDEIKKDMAENGEDIHRLAGVRGVVVQAHFEVVHGLMKHMIETGLLRDAGEVSFVTTQALIAITGSTVEQVMATLVMNGMPEVEVAEGCKAIAEDLKEACDAAAVEARKIAANPEAHGYENWNPRRSD